MILTQRMAQHDSVTALWSPSHKPPVKGFPSPHAAGSQNRASLEPTGLGHLNNGELKNATYTPLLDFEEII